METIIRPAERRDLPALGGLGALLIRVHHDFDPLRFMAPRQDAEFVVGQDARRQGVATRLVEAAAAWLENRGSPRIMLWTAEKNVEARSLFTRLGFRRTMIEMTRERERRKR